MTTRWRPDFCESADPESKGVVEHLAGYVQVDLVVPEDGFGGKPAVANPQARVWGLEVNGRVHSEIQAVPTIWVGRTLEVMVQDGEVAMGLDGEEITRHQLQPPGGISIHDEHYRGPARPPARAIRVRTETERAFIALGPVAEGFLRSAAVAGTSRLAGELVEIVSLE